MDYDDRFVWTTLTGMKKIRRRRSQLSFHVTRRKKLTDITKGCVNTRGILSSGKIPREVQNYNNNESLGFMRASHRKL